MNSPCTTVFRVHHKSLVYAAVSLFYFYDKFIIWKINLDVYEYLGKVYGSICGTVYVRSRRRLWIRNAFRTIFTYHKIFRTQGVWNYLIKSLYIIHHFTSNMPWYSAIINYLCEHLHYCALVVVLIIPPYRINLV